MDQGIFHNAIYVLKKKRGAPGRGLKVVRAFTNSPQTLSESKFAKIQISHFRGGGGR